MSPVITVTGASGNIGGRVARLLAAAGATQRLVARDPSTLPDLPDATAVRGAEYADAEGLRTALAGTDVLLLVSARESADRVHEHTTAIDAAVAAGVQRIVYTSFLGAAADCTFTFGRDHWHTEQHLRSTGVPFVALRDSTYSSGLPAMTGADGILRGPAADGRVSAVTPADVAAVAAAVLLDPAHDGQVLDVTGPEAITLAEAAEELTRVTGRPVAYQEETEAEAYESRAGYGAPAFEVAGWVTSYTAIATGELSTVSDTVPRLTGRPAQSFAEFLRLNPSSYAHLLP
ncbi:SDR family oxidoreductase [Actinokineospora sp. NBRC 105648]|uniref:SDR family oxidoreductase n=1 Tax=Actinokineospora sp. NBRC 105648 TaxID=3032206 RepID=UPI0024A02B94|nr:SDR family oxidoreductase [Actinokineospora sp. NBRC 105648]GLZ43062.1 NAD(P)-dependent oxidoreductase [Actinokineospora sp. NBRC 105648]